MSLARLSVKNPVPVNLLMIAIVLIGLASMLRLPRELISNVAFHWVFVVAPYPGVAAEEIEKLVTVPIEEELRDVHGIETLTSQSSEGQAFVMARFEDMGEEEFRARLQDVRAAVDEADLPEDVLDPIIQAFDTSALMPLVSVHVSGSIPEAELRDLARQLRDEVREVSDVSKVELVGIRDRKVWVDADPGKLEGYGLSPAQLQAAIQGRGINVSAGELDLHREVLLLRSIGEFDGGKDVEKVVVRASPGGGVVRVKDVADVHEGFEKAHTSNSLDTLPVVSLTVTKRAEGSSIAIIDEIKRISRDFETRQQGRVRVAFTQDSSELIEDILAKLSSNAALGFVVVVIVLLLVIGLRNAVLAALGIPISFLACFIFMEQAGESLNGNSLFGLVLVLGIVVDDAIIIVENCYRHLQQGKTWREAAIAGTDEVVLPILAATGTTVAAFLPMMLLPGIIGKFMRIIPITVSLALIASLIEAFLILPSHFADWPGRRLTQVQERRWFAQLREQYERAVRYVVARRYLFATSMFFVIPGAAALVPLVGVDMWAEEEPNTFQVRLRMPTGTNLAATRLTLAELERTARELPPEEVRAVYATAGLMVSDPDWIFRRDVGQIWLDLPLSYDRGRSTDAIMADLRDRMQKIPGPTSIELAKLNTGPPVGKPVEVRVQGMHLEALRAVTAELEAYLEQLDGVIEVGDDFREGSPELRLQVDADRAAFHGLSVGEASGALYAAVNGLDASVIHDGDEEVDVVVRVAPEYFREPADVLRLPLALPNGGTIHLGDVAQVDRRASIAEIRRFDHQRAITVSADLDPSKTDVMKVNGALAERFEQMSARYPSVRLHQGGEFEEFKQAFADIGVLFLVGVLLMYVILGAQFHSYIQPIVILFTVPFAFVGAVIGLLISGNPFSIATLFGMVALAGVAVNDAIVLVSFANGAIREGVAPEEAVVRAGCLRLRPVLLTSVTTVAGLLPMAMGLGGMSLSWGPLANTVVWGLWVATILTLFFIPALYLVFAYDIPRVLGLAGRGEPPAPAT